MRCEAESTQVNFLKKKLSLYLLNTVTVVEMNSLLHLESICLSKQPPAPPHRMHSAPPVSRPLIRLRASFFLQLSPEEGYVSAKEDCFFYTAQSLEEEGPADAALFHAELALVSGPTYHRFLQSLHFVVKGVALSLSIYYCLFF